MKLKKNQLLPIRKRLNKTKKDKSTPRNFCLLVIAKHVKLSDTRQLYFYRHWDYTIRCSNSSWLYYTQYILYVYLYIDM